MSRVYNFSAGPSMLPEEVLRKAADEMLDYEGCGQSVMEMSHRSKEYEGIIRSAESLLRELMNIPENYKVLFLQGGASTQFAAIPLNLMNGSGKADYVVTGQWANKAYQRGLQIWRCTYCCPHQRIKPFLTSQSSTKQISRRMRIISISA